MRLKLFITLLFLSIAAKTGDCATTSYDHTFVANDVFASDFHTRLNANFTKSLTGGINSINSANVVDDSMGEAEMADEINPRIRTYEGAACEFVYTGLLPVTSGTLSTTIAAGTAYPRGYRINKASTTPKTFTASKHTYVDLDINGDFQYSEVAIGGATPSVAANSIRLAKVSTDTSTVNTVTDLRRISCANGPFSNITSTSDANEPTLEDMLKNGQPVRRFSRAGRTPQGFVQGFFVSYDTATTFKVTSGSAYINGEYRSTSQDISVPQTTDDPSAGTSGIVSGVIAASTDYSVYLVADQDSTKIPSVSFGTAATGLTNYRQIGSIKTGPSGIFLSQDVTTIHAISEREIIGAWINFNGVTNDIRNSYNVSSITDNGTGDFTVTWDVDFNNANYSLVCAGRESGTEALYVGITSQAVGSARIFVSSHTGGNTDSTFTNCIAIGDSRV